MKFCVVLLALLCLHKVSAINEARREALKTIEQNVTNIIKLGEKINADLKWKPQRIHSIYSMILTQGTRIADNRILEIEDEVKISYAKAEIMGCKNPVYTCIANEANNGEDRMKKMLAGFKYNIYSIMNTTDNTQKKNIQDWTNDINAKEKTYRNEYNSATYKIVSAKTIKEIQDVVTKFANATKVFKGDIEKIDLTINNIQLAYLDTMQNASYALKNTLIAENNKIVTEIKKCFTKKL